ncbi:M50 family metallopeptidase [Anaerotruncus rubiinfantis]|jgi:regulator of sigma E protease|uniref:M50 family metallopeptidase n=2 Tax=Anaerotruncus rubiinfantis TaxID=1720200 RepID=UPI00189C4B10|nr:site-2 protease family protein [Anaerotruncus rubiinfantis]
MSVIFQVIVAVLVFGLLIFIHELGHFTVGKLSGMRVNEFAIGMGPALFSWHKGETQYSLRALPVGGYVSVEGEDEDSSDPRAFCNVMLWKRILFVCAGAIMNLLLGFIILSILVGMRTTLPTTTISEFHPDPADGAAAVSNEKLMVGDKILKINGTSVFTSNDITFSMISDRDGVVDFTVLRDGQKLEIPQVQFKMDTAEDGTRLINLDFYVYSAEKTFLNSVQYTVLWMFSIVRQVWLSFLNLITGNFTLAELSGPVGVSTVIGQASTAGLKTLLTLVGFITVNIGVFNLLPVPALDGGRLIFLLIELVIRRPVNPKYEGFVHAAGFILLMGLMLVVTLNDIVKLF